MPGSRKAAGFFFGPWNERPIPIRKRSRAPQAAISVSGHHPSRNAQDALQPRTEWQQTALEEVEDMGGWFTREDWRPGKGRRSYPRLHAYGGRKEAPAAFLAMSGSVAGFGSGRHRMCSVCGKLPAMRGIAVCRIHGGAAWAVRRRPFIGRYLPRPDAPKPEPVT